MIQIDRAESWLLRLPQLTTTADTDGATFEIVGVTLEGDGLTGTGFAWVGGTNTGGACRKLLDDVLLPEVLGRRPTDVARIWDEFQQRFHRSGNGITRFAMAAVDVALWDMRSRGHGLSLAREIGQLTDRVPAYGSGRAGVRLPTAELVELSAGYAEAGFHGVKVLIGLDPDADIGRVEAVRQAIGSDVKIMCDANERFDYLTAVTMARKLVDLDVHWLEEPMPSTDLEGHRRLGLAVPLAIVGGEHHHSAEEFVPYATSGAFSVLQPNFSLVGGVTEMIRIARLAELAGVSYAPQALHELHLHLAACTRSSTYLEYFPLLEPFIERPVELDGGDLIVPTAPGHGVQFT